MFFSDRKQPVRVEVQIRTIAMNFWACLEEEIFYKQDLPDSQAIGRELKECADVISHTDLRMQSIHQQLRPTSRTRRMLPDRGQRWARQTTSRGGF